MGVRLGLLPWGFRHSPRRHRATHSVRAFLTAALITSVAFGSLPAGVSGSDTAYAADVPSCRSVDGTLNTSNGSYTDASSKLRIEPVYSKRMYADIRNGFDATYIGYRVWNEGTAARSGLRIAVENFSPGVVSLANPLDAIQPLPNLSPKSSAGNGTAFFFVTASGYSSNAQSHTVRVLDPSTNQTLLTCTGGFDSVERSIAARANKITAISATSAILGSTLTVTVDGAPGTVGSGAVPDGDIFALSPASRSSWPTRALRLESLSVVVKGIKGGKGEIDTCAGTNGGESSPSTKSATFRNTLVLRSMQKCFTKPGQTYQITYVFRVIGGNATNPTVNPIASIASGTQVKYTGTYPSRSTAVNLTGMSYPQVTKSYTSAALPNPQTSPQTILVTYSLQARLGTTAPNATGVRIDELVDNPAEGAVLKTASYTDATQTSSKNLVPVETGSGADRTWRFIGPFTMSKTSTTNVGVVITYTVSYPLPATGVKVSYSNDAWGLTDTWLVGSTSTVFDSINVEVASTGVTGSSKTTSSLPKVSQTIQFDTDDTLGVGVQVVLNGYSSSGLPVSYTASPVSSCAVSEFDGVWTLTALSVGECVVVAGQSGDSIFGPATPVSQTIRIGSAQTITARPGPLISANILTEEEYVDFVSTSLLQIDVTNLTPDVCSLDPVKQQYTSSSGTTRVYVRPISNSGTCSLAANQPGNTTWPAAREVLVHFGVGKSQFILVASPAVNATINPLTDPSIVVEGTGASATRFVPVVSTAWATDKVAGDFVPSYLPVSLQSLTPTVCLVRLKSMATDPDELDSGYQADGSTRVDIRLVGAGTCRLALDQDGYDNNGASSLFALAPTVTHSFEILPWGEKTQTLHVLTPDTTSRVYGGSLTAEIVSRTTGGSATGLEVEISGTPEVCALGTSRLNDSAITVVSISLVGTGTCTITGRQPGNNEYSKATDVSVSFLVGKKSLTVDETSLSVESKVYDGTREASISGTPRLAGALPLDLIDGLTLSLNPVGQFASAEVQVDSEGNPISQTVIVSEVVLGGASASNYEAPSTLKLQGVITHRAITVKATNQTVNSGQDIPCEPEVSSGSLVSGQAVTPSTEFFSCTVSYDDSVSPPKPVSQVIGLVSITEVNGGANRSTNYIVTYAPGTITVETRTIPVISASDIEITYGDSVLDDFPVTGGESDSTPHAKKSVGDTVKLAGRFVYTVGGKKLSEQILDEGQYSLTVEFKPDDDTVAPVSRVHTITVKPRPVSYTVTTPTSKVYDGQTTVSLSMRTNAPTGSTGFLSSDESGDLVTVDFPEEGRSASSAVGSWQISWSHPALSGPKARNYVLEHPNTVHTIRIAPRALHYRFGTLTKVYDGNAEIELSGATLEAEPGGDGLGILTGDDVTLSLPEHGTLSTSSAGTHAVSWTQASVRLDGSKAGNYTLAHPLSATGTVLPRPITLEIKEYTKLSTEPDPKFLVLLDANSTLAVGEDLDDAVPERPVTVRGRIQSNAVGSFPLDIEEPNDPKNNNPNYRVTRVSGILYVAELDVNTSGTLDPVTKVTTLDSRTVTCNCAGLKPESTATLTIYSTPTVVTTVTVQPDGTCPFATKGTIPTSVDDGNHTLELAGIFPNGDAAQITKPVALVAPPPGGTGGGGANDPDPLDGSDGDPLPDLDDPDGANNGGGNNGGGNTPDTSGRDRRDSPRDTPRLTEGPGVLTRGIPTLPVRPNTPGSSTNGRSSTEDTGQGLTRPGANGSQPDSTNGHSGGAPRDTIDVGNGVISLAGDVPGSTEQGSRTLGELASENIGGFQPGSGLRIEVIGSRTTARFLLSSIQGIDQAVIIAAIQQSYQTQNSEFAQLTNVTGTTAPLATLRWNVLDQRQADEVFSFSRLSSPQPLSGLNPTPDMTWIQVTMEGQSYLPGSVVYLTVTSSPTVVRQGIVGDDGTITLDGALPLEALGPGEHRIRLVGTRVFEGIQVDDQGEVIIPEEVLASIQEFDMGTHATVIVRGTNDSGGTHTVKRVVPLDPVAPWWAVWLIVWTAFLMFVAKVRGKLARRSERVWASLLILGSSVPAIYFGWTSTVTVVMWWGLAAGISLSLALWLVPTLFSRDAQATTRTRVHHS